MDTSSGFRRGCNFDGGERTTGTVNPGVVYIVNKYQPSLEYRWPNRRGHHKRDPNLLNGRDQANTAPANEASIPTEC